MMTPTARIEFWYELMLSDGSKEKHINFQTANGVWDATQLISKHHIKPPSYTTILNGKERKYVIDRLPYDRAKNERETVAYFNNANSYIDRKYPYKLPVVSVLLCFQRIDKLKNRYPEYR